MGGGTRGKGWRNVKDYCLELARCNLIQRRPTSLLTMFVRIASDVLFDIDKLIQLFLVSELQILLIDYY